MAWVCKSYTDMELVFEEKPTRIKLHWEPSINSDTNCVILPDGSIKKLIGRELCWEDEPVELKEG